MHITQSQSGAWRVVSALKRLQSQGRQIKSLLTIFSGLLFFFPAGWGSAAPIDQRVLDQLAAQGQATVWVVLARQADLKPANQIWDWKARGAFVQNQLTTVANQTQPGLLALLQGRGATFKPF